MTETIERFKTRYQQSFCDWEVPPVLNMHEWADENYYLPEGDANAGKWKTLPYQIGILDTFTDPEVETITLMKSARIGYTQMLNISIAYHIDYDPCNQLIVQPTIEDARNYSKDSIQPMLETVPCLMGTVSEAKGRDQDNTVLKKNYGGYVLNIIGANSARGFRRISAKIVNFDEVEGYPATAGQEGDQIELGKRRSDDYHDRKIIIGSTPTFKNGRIHDSFEHSDKRFYNVPCPKCKQRQTLKWRNLDFGKYHKGGTIENPVMVCEHCKKGIAYDHQRWMIERGEWIATAPFNGHAGFHIWAAYSYSPNATWSKIVKEFLKSHKSREKMQVWTNTVLGEPFEEKGESFKWEDIAARREEYQAPVPQDGLFLVMSVDIQKHYIIGEVAAIGKGEESFGVDFFFENGNPEQGEVWEKLRRKLDATYQHESGIEMGIAITVVDSGNWTDQVYKFVASVKGKRIYAVKGGSTANLPRISIPTIKNRFRLPVFTVGTDTIKDSIFNRLSDVTKPGHGYLHFPDHYPDEYFEQLTAEEMKQTFKMGVPVRKYVQIRPRNEALDLNVYKYAAIEILNPDYKKIEENLNLAAEKVKTVENGQQSTNQNRPPKRSGGWVNKWKG